MSTIEIDALNREAERDGSIGGIVLAREGLQEKVRELSKVNDLRFLWDVFRQWLIIIASITGALWIGHWGAYAIAILVIATRQHALGVLMHDGTHFRCLSNRIANNIMSDLLCAFPIGMTTSRYRYEHLLHHRFLNTDRDPYWLDYKFDDDWHWPKTPGKAIWVFLRDLLGMNLFRTMPVMYRWSPWINHFSKKVLPPPLERGERIRLYAFILTLLALLFVTKAWLYFLIFWVYPLATITFAMMRLRTIGEHLGIPNKNELDASRHTDGTLFERLSIAPFNINYHIDHHLFASVPYYNLPELHRALLQNPYYRQHALLNHSYLSLSTGGLLHEVIIPRAAPQASPIA